MEPITYHSLDRAGEEAVRLWALASAQYPKQHTLVLKIAAASIIEAVSAFALNARRAMELLPFTERIMLTQPRWSWQPVPGAEVVDDLRDALNRIVHARSLEVGFEDLPRHLSAIDGGAVVVPYVRAATDRRPRAMIDPFALSHAFLYQALPKLTVPKGRASPNH
jgi:hypothetical protein